VKEKISALADDDAVKLAVSSNGKALANSYKSLTKKLMRAQIVKDGKRVDGRNLDEVRPISAAAGVLPKRVHGSALFQRGLTQVLSCATLGTPSDAQELDDLNPSTEKHYLHHYNFPPYSTGETKPMRSPGRREVGHGALAERAILPVLPSKESFPYVLRGFGVPQLQRLHLDGFGVRQHPGPDGCRRAPQGSGERRGDGPDQGGRRGAHPYRHSGHRGFPRRYGLQGGRHREGHHRPADGYEGHGPQRQNDCRSHPAGPPRQAAHPREDARGDRQAPRHHVAPRPAPAQLPH